MKKTDSASKKPSSKTTEISKTATAQKNAHQSPFSVVFISLLMGFLGGWMALTLFNSNGLIQPSTSSSDTSSTVIVDKDSQAIRNVAKKVGPSVVSITVETEVENPFFSRIFTQSGAGTGIILTKDGLILTNRHVVPENVSSVKVVLSDGTNYDDVEVVDRDAFNDLAFLQIKDVDNLTPAKLGDSSQVEVGDRVVAIGNALGQFSNTVTSGIISGIGRPVTASEGYSQETLSNLLQTDAAINPGNSGGPLVNINGEVIGLNTAMAGGAENIGFAIPINDAKSDISSVQQEGRIIRPYLGVRYIGLTSDIAKDLDLSVDRGAYLYANRGKSAIIPDSPADKAGLKDEDIITEVNGEKVDGLNDLSSLLGKYKVGDEVSLKVIRGDKEITVKATLEEAPDNL